jgi:FG-GAP-like repeat
MALIGLSWVPLAHGSLFNTPKPQPRSTVLATRDLPVLYDLDGDFRGDRVSLQSNGFDKTISIKFGNARNTELGFTARSADRGNLVADDIDRDGDLDLIWVGSSEQNTVVFINNGKGDFTEANDNAQYASELSALFSSGDPSHQHYLDAGRPTYSLTSSSFSDTGLAVAIRFARPTIQLAPRPSLEGFANQPGFLACLPKRGPPPIHS